MLEEWECSYLRQQRAAVLSHWSLVWSYIQQTDLDLFRQCSPYCHCCSLLVFMSWPCICTLQVLAVIFPPPCNGECFPELWQPTFSVRARPRSELKLFLCTLVRKALKLWLSAPFFFVFLLPVCASVRGGLMIFPPWRFDLNISSAKTDQFALFMLTSVSVENLLWQNSDIWMVCVFVFAVKGQFVYIWIYQYTYFLKHFCMFQSCFLTCVYHGRLWCCMCALQAYS